MKCTMFKACETSDSKLGFPEKSRSQISNALRDAIVSAQAILIDRAVNRA